MKIKFLISQEMTLDLQITGLKENKNWLEELRSS